jgi:hypothetical protein
MAGITEIGTVDVTCVLATGVNTIMATGTGAQHFIMIHRGGRYRTPAGRKFFVAGITLFRSVNVAGIFTTRDDAIVTGDAVASESGMIWCASDTTRGPGCRGVADIALVVGGDMCRPFTRSYHAIVTT